MGIFNRLFGKKATTDEPGMEDYMTLIRVYFQASIASNVGITNLAMLPDLRVFKSTLKVPTVNNKLGVGEKSRCRKMLSEMYGTDDNFFKEIDQSVRKNCRKLQDVQVYLVQFQTFTQDLMMLMGSLMKFKNDYTDAATMKTVLGIRQYAKKLGFSEAWISRFVFQLVMLAKKQPKAPQE